MLDNLKGFSLGAIRDIKDERDFVAQNVQAHSDQSFPKEYIVPWINDIPIYNQGDVGSCVAHACATAIVSGLYNLNNNEISKDLSRGFIYGNRNEYTDYLGEGMMPREALKHLNHEGVCINELFPYNEIYPIVYSMIHESQETEDKLFNNALQCNIKNYYKVYSINEIKQAILDTGSVIVCVDVFDNFGVKNITDSENLVGCHEMCVVGWNEFGWILRNSWGEEWGDNGNCYISYNYPNLDFWAFTVNNKPINKKESATTINKQKYTFFQILKKILHFIWKF